MLHPDYPIHTERLVLRPFTTADFDDLHAYDQRPDVARYLYWEARTEAESRESLERKLHRTALTGDDQGIVLAVEWPEAGRVVGEVNLQWLSKEHQQGEVGFTFNPEFHGRGVATEAARAMLRLGFQDLGLHRIAGRCDARNERSVKLMERLGMRREAHFKQHQIFKGDWDEEMVYAMLRTEWEG